MHVELKVVVSLKCQMLEEGRTIPEGHAFAQALPKPHVFVQMGRSQVQSGTQRQDKTKEN